MSRYEKLSPRRPCVIYSFGITYEPSFEEALLRRTECQLFAADSALFDMKKAFKSLTAEQRDRAHFRQVGIGAKSDATQDPPVHSMKDLMKLNDHAYVDIIKMDIQASEFEVMAGLLENIKNDPLPIGQFLVTIHLDEKPEVDLPYFLKWWEKLEKAGFRAVWMEPKLTYVTAKKSGGHANPSYAEVSDVSVRGK